MLVTFKQIFINYLNSLAFSLQTLKIILQKVKGNREFFHFWIVVYKFDYANFKYYCRLADPKLLYHIYKLFKYFTLFQGQP